MKSIILKKKTKKITLKVKSIVNERNETILRITVHGPLGEISYNFKNINYIKPNKFFLEENQLNFFINKIKKLIISVTNG